MGFVLFDLMGLASCSVGFIISVALEDERERCTDIGPGPIVQVDSFPGSTFVWVNAELHYCIFKPTPIS